MQAWKITVSRSYVFRLYKIRPRLVQNEEGVDAVSTFNISKAGNIPGQYLQKVNFSRKFFIFSLSISEGSIDGVIAPRLLAPRASRIDLRSSRVEVIPYYPSLIRSKGQLKCLLDLERPEHYMTSRSAAVEIRVPCTACDQQASSQ